MQVAEHVARAKTPQTTPPCFSVGKTSSSAELLQELLSRKVYRGACTEMYNDAQKCSDFAQEFRDVKLHLFPCPVERLSDCETLPGLDECLLRLDFRMELDNFLGHFCPGLAPRAARWRNAPIRHAVSCTSGKPVDGANACEAAHPSSGMTSWFNVLVPSSSLLRCSKCLRDRSSCGSPTCTEKGLRLTKTSANRAGNS